jgi:hypothetical protein
MITKTPAAPPDLVCRRESAWPDDRARRDHPVLT